MSLSQKISAGFLVVLLLHIAVALMGHLGQSRAQDDLIELDQGNKLTREMLEVDRLVGELQSNVQGYTLSGNRGLAMRAKGTYEQVVALLDELRSHLDVADIEGVHAMREILAGYARNFGLAMEDRTRRNALVQQVLPDLERQFAELFAELHAALPDRVEVLRQAEAEVVVAENGAYEYLAQLDSGAMDKARQSLAYARDVFDVRLAGHAELRASCARGRELCQQFDRVLLGLVQSTRGYLHLVNVVMAAEAVEVLRTSAALREAALRRVEALRDAIQTQQRDYQWWSTLVSVATIVLGLVAGAFVGRLVVHPLQAITATLGRLTRGESVDIPGLERRDEIGDMAAAAQRLREHNEEAERMLVEKQQMAERQERMISDLERSNRDLDNFAHIASHDLKAPLRAIVTLLRWLDEDCGDDLPEVAQQHLEKLNQRVTRMNALLQDLQEYSKASRSVDALRMVDVYEQIADAVELVDPVSFPVTITGDEDVRLYTAPVPLTQVLGNLLSNAMHHHDRESGRIGVDVRGTEAGVRIAITDDGPGIPVEYQGKVFEPFQTLQAREDRGNTGVGLAIVTKVAQRYRASVRIESPVADGRGARFVVDWPHSPRAAAAADSRAAADGGLVGV